MHILLHRLLCLTLIVPACVLAGTGEKLPLDAVIVMDSSGSMKQSDPRELRKPAAKLFINLLGEADRVSVMSFSDNAYPITYLAQLNTAENEQRALQATDKVSSKGMLTNIHAALVRGIELLKDSHAQGHDPVLVLMSDGKLDVGDKIRNEELRQKIQNDLLPTLKEKSIRVFSIAFTTQSDQSLLQQIADASGGSYTLAETDDKLHIAFSKIFEQSKEPNMLPLTENQFVVDASIREVTLIANKKSEQSKIFVESPGGERFNAEKPGKNMRWFASSNFDMITLTKPAVGTWKILFSDNDNKAYIVADVELRTQFDYNNDAAASALNIKTWFKKDQEIVKESEFLANMGVKLEVAHPDGQTETLDFAHANEQGEFIITFKPTQSGIYGATVTATSKTFQRQQSFSFRSSLPEKTEAVPEPPHTPATETKHEPAPVAEPEKPAEAEHDDMTKTIMIFVIGNIVLLLVGLNVFFVIKMKKRKATAEANDGTGE